MILRGTNNIKLTFVISSLSAGGAERVMSLMANYFSNKKYDITIMTFNLKEISFYELNKKIKHVSLSIASDSKNMFIASFKNIFRVLKIRKEIKKIKPNIIISFVDKTNILTLFASKGLHIPVIISERVDPRYYFIGKFWNILRRITYLWAAALVVQTEDVKHWALLSLSKNVLVIPNPIDIETRNKGTDKFIMPKGKIIIGLGRLRQQKGFDILIKAFAKISDHFSNWNLIILGDGKERENLEALIKILNLKNRIFLPGLIHNPILYLKKADIFVLSSHFEGFPNALLEAMSCGLPVISFDCPSGPREIIRDSIDGILVPPDNMDKLAEAMYDLMNNEEKRKKLGIKALEINERFKMEKVMAKWEALIEKNLRY